MTGSHEEGGDLLVSCAWCQLDLLSSDYSHIQLIALCLRKVALLGSAFLLSTSPVKYSVVWTLYIAQYLWYCKFSGVVSGGWGYSWCKRLTNYWPAWWPDLVLVGFRLQTQTLGQRNLVSASCPTSASSLNWAGITTFCCCCLVIKLCVTLWPHGLYYSMSGFPVLHHLPEFA